MTLKSVFIILFMLHPCLCAHTHTHTVITIKSKERNYINFRIGMYRRGGRESTWERVEDKIERKNYYYSIPIKTHLTT